MHRKAGDFVMRNEARSSQHRDIAMLLKYRSREMDTGDGRISGHDKMNSGKE